jgi:signal peptidase I
LIVILSIIVKFSFCDTIRIKTDQMAPTVVNGDRIILSKNHYAAPMKFILSPQYTNIVAFKHPHFNEMIGCLRITGKPGDRIAIKKGIFTIAGKPKHTISSNHSDEDLLPGKYSPRDNMISFYIPQKGDTILPDTMGIRDIIFIYSMMKQENPTNPYRLKPALHVDDSLNNDYLIKDFSLYTGRFNNIPDSLFSDWLFWKNLQSYFDLYVEDKKIKLSFSIMEHQKMITEYIVKQNFYFLLSDSWDFGYDSRYFGPICQSVIFGRVTGVIWSFAPDKSAFSALRPRRICKILK